MSQNSFQCNFCDKTFTENKNLRAHLNNVHKLFDSDVHQHAPAVIFARNTSVCALCKEHGLRDFESMKTHCQGHNVELQKKVTSFENAYDFDEWKAQKEKETSAQFCKNRGIKRQNNVSQYYTLYCSRTGKYATRSEGGMPFKNSGLLTPCYILLQ